MDYVRVDFADQYIYLENSVLAFSRDMKRKEYRAKELLFQRPMWRYKRIKRISKLPIDKTINVWYHVGTTKERK
jgi:hypothetical protein